LCITKLSDQSVKFRFHPFTAIAVQFLVVQRYVSRRRRE
jgi:hypothetical protein